MTYDDWESYGEACISHDPELIPEHLDSVVLDDAPDSFYTEGKA